MAESIKGFYNRRHPEKTDYYRIIEGCFEEFERRYPELFEEKYGVRNYENSETYRRRDKKESTSKTQPFPGEQSGDLV